MAQFQTKLRVEKITARDGKSFWRLLAPLVYHSDLVSILITAPKKFLTDFASVPRLPLAYLIAGDTAHEAAVVHDYLYCTNGVSRRVADAIFYEAMRVSGEPRWRAFLMWSAVRVSAWVAWRRYRRLSLKAVIRRHVLWQPEPPDNPPQAP
jgi:hypothetical protein